MTFAGRLESWCVAQEKTTLPDYPSQDGWRRRTLLHVAHAELNAYGRKASGGMCCARCHKIQRCSKSAPPVSLLSQEHSWRRRDSAGVDTCDLLLKVVRRTAACIKAEKRHGCSNGAGWGIRPASFNTHNPLTSAPFWDPTNGPSSTRSIQHQPAASCGRFRELRIAALPRDNTPFTTARTRIDPRSVLTLLIRWQRANGRLYREYPPTAERLDRSHRTHGGLSKRRMT